MTEKLRKLQEQASPGEWHVHERRDSNDEERFYELCFQEDDSDGGRRHRPLGNIWGDNAVWLTKEAGDGANAKLAALAPHLLPLAEALEKAASECELWIDYLPDMVKPDRLQAETAGIQARVADYRKALTDLKEALDA